MTVHATTTKKTIKSSETLTHSKKHTVILFHCFFCTEGRIVYNKNRIMKNVHVFKPIALPYIRSCEPYLFPD